MNSLSSNLYGLFSHCISESLCYHINSQITRYIENKQRSKNASVKESHIGTDNKIITSSRDYLKNETQK